METPAKIDKRFNFKGFSNGAIYFLGLIGISVEPKEPLKYLIYKKITFTVAVLVYFMQIAFVSFGCGTIYERYTGVIFVNYYTAALGKNIVVNFNRLALVKAFEEFEIICPNIYEVQCYNLKSYLRNYKILELFLYNFFKYIVLLYTLQPIVESFVMLWLNGEFGYMVPLFLWPTVPENNGYVLYTIYALLCIWISHFIGFNILSIDLSLLTCLSQLCAHFDLLSQRLGELQPEKEDSVKELKNIIQDHQKVLSIFKNVNTVFALSILFSLGSSTFILCFVAYQLLDENSLVEFIKAFLLLGYEMKQIVLICFFGDKLMQTSSRVFDKICMQDWYKGSPEYRRLIIIFLMHTRRPVAINVLGVSNISLITLKQVFSNAYQIFAVLKTRQADV